MRIAIIGGGTVGGGVIEMLEPYHPDIEIVYLVVRDVSRQRDFRIPTGCIVTGEISIVMQDATIDVVVELMGGTDVAWTEVVQKAIARGTHVVTGNKALISKYLPAIEAINKAGTSGTFLYEAAVCGGIPIVNAFLRGMTGDEITSIFGVMNGSTNWMLDKMYKEGSSYEMLLDEAKSLGYLEADPAADIQGWDARSKLCILARIAFGIFVDEARVSCIGIDVVSQADMKYVKSEGKWIRLVAKAWKENGKVHAFVMPAIVPGDMAIGNLPGSGNCVCYTTKYSGTHAMLGSGAGRYPTANSVVADILDIKNGKTSGKWFGDVDGKGSTYEADFDAKFYVRYNEGIREHLKNEGIDSLKLNDNACITDIVAYSKLRTAITSFTTDLVTIMIVM